MHSSVIVLALCASLALPNQGGEPAWKQVEPGRTLVFPRDHGAHPEFRTEWWYLTGHLEDERGARFGFQFTVFRQGLVPGAPATGESPLRVHQAFAGHLALTDVARGETRFAERLRRASPLARATEDELDLALEDWSLRRNASDELALAAADPTHGFGMELTLRPEKPLVLHGERGYSRKGAAAGNASEYVSWTRLAVAGKLVVDGAERTVRGTAWFDHEFGSSVLDPGVLGWDWFALQLADGRELMLFLLRDAHGAPIDASAGTLVERDGTTRALARADFTIAASARWTSAKSGADYPARWTIAVPSAELALEVAPLVADCELVARLSTNVTYWEGPVDVTGTTSGRGYAELTGYAGAMTGRF